MNESSGVAGSSIHTMSAVAGLPKVLKFDVPWTKWPGGRGCPAGPIDAGAAVQPVQALSDGNRVAVGKLWPSMLVDLQNTQDAKASCWLLYNINWHSRSTALLASAAHLRCQSMPICRSAFDPAAGCERPLWNL